MLCDNYGRTNNSYNCSFSFSSSFLNGFHLAQSCHCEEKNTEERGLQIFAFYGPCSRSTYAKIFLFSIYSEKLSTKLLGEKSILNTRHVFGFLLRSFSFQTKKRLRTKLAGGRNSFFSSCQEIHLEKPKEAKNIFFSMADDVRKSHAKK